MDRLRSKTGCFRCRLRRKKCDERRPICAACARHSAWSNTCSYAADLSRRGAPNALALAIPADASRALLSRSLPDVQHGDDEAEFRVLQTIPESIKAFFSPASAKRIRDLQTMWQLMMSNEILRNACVACFSRITDSSAALVRLSQETYGKALQTLRQKILLVNLDQETAICVVASIVFLGKMESFGPQSHADALEHWIPLIHLLASDQIERLSERRILPANEKTLMFESLLYHVGTHAIFSKATKRVWDLWQAHNIYRRICMHNPEGAGRIGRSALLSGQYPLYNMALQVTYLLQHHPGGHLPSRVADEMELAVHRHDASLDRDFAAAVSAETLTSRQKAECAIYHFFCNSLLVCITLLREPSESQRNRMEQLVDTGMDLFLATPVYGDVEHLSKNANHFMLAAIWPVQIQGCASYDNEQFQIFMDHFAMLERSLDPGHRRRAQSLLGQVGELLESLSLKEVSIRTQNTGRDMPAGLMLLRSPIAMPEPIQEDVST